MDGRCVDVSHLIVTQPDEGGWNGVAICEGLAATLQRFASEANLGSSRAAMATLLNGPSSRMVISPGYLWTMRIMKLTADSSAARIVGAPSASGGTKNGSA